MLMLMLSFSPCRFSSDDIFHFRQFSPFHYFDISPSPIFDYFLHAFAVA